MDALRYSLAVLLLAALAPALHAQQAQQAEQAEQENPLLSLGWQLAPDVGEIERRATITIPQDYGFLGPADTDRFLELNENLPTGRDHLFTPLSLDWNAYFAFDPIGYVEDDDELDADALLEAKREGNATANEERRSRGWAELDVVGWHTRPRYDPATNRLEWAVLFASQGSEVVNYNTRFLGRKGVMEVTLVTSPEHLEQAIREFNVAAEGFSFNEGDRYSEYQEGDKLAAYGLAALVAGGAAAVAAKGGAKFGKAILFAVIAGIAALWAAAKRFFVKK